MTRPQPGPAHEPRLSHYQERIIEFVTEGRGNGVVRATAGAGKTSTLVAVAARLDPASRACFLAFGRDAAAELGRRLPPWVAAMTVHSLGRKTLERALRARQKRLQPVEKGKYRRLLGSCLEGLPPGAGLGLEARASCEEYVTSLLGLARLELVEAGDEDALRDLVARHAIVPPDRELLPLANSLLWRVLELGVSEALVKGVCDFTDMLYLPVTQSFQPARFDFVCVDEAQDYSSAALAFTRQLVDPKAGGRLLFVGDPRQSIYGFAGADAEAMERIVGETGATVLPLSITYRCPRSHVALARLLAPEIEAGPTATEGRVFWVRDRVLEHWAREGDMIICRANAPLVKTCLRLVRSGLRAHVRGRDLERQLVELAERALPGQVRNPAARLAEFESSEVARLRRLVGHGAEPIVEARRDLIDCLRFLLGSVTGKPLPTKGLRDRIEETFAEQENAVVLSTIHRAKGLESDRILILYPELMPAPYARTAQSLRGEAAVQFVALTRARKDLVFISDSPADVRRPRKEKSRLVSAEHRTLDIEEGGGRDGSVRGVGLSDEAGLSMEDRVGQGKGVWQEVLELARLLARARG